MDRNVRRYFVYIASSWNGTLYVGVTNDPVRRIGEHQEGKVTGFTAKYRIDRLLYVEEAPSALVAVEREKQLKRWRREKKMRLIATQNPEGRDLASEEIDGVSKRTRVRFPPGIDRKANSYG